MRRFFCSLVAKTSQQASVGKSVYVYAALRGGLIIEKTVVRYCGYCCPWIRVRAVSAADAASPVVLVVAGRWD